MKKLKELTNSLSKKSSKDDSKRGSHVQSEEKGEEKNEKVLKTSGSSIFKRKGSISSMKPSPTLTASPSMSGKDKKMEKSASSKAKEKVANANQAGFVGSQYDSKTLLANHVNKTFGQTMVEMYFVHLAQTVQTKKMTDIKVRLGALIVTEGGFVIVDHQEDFYEETLTSHFVPFDKLKEVNVDRKYEGLLSFSSIKDKDFTLLLLDSDESLQQFVNFIESGREKAKKANLSLPQLMITKTFIVDSTEDAEEEELEGDEVSNESAMDRLMGYVLDRGYAIQDVWNGAIDLRQLYRECGSQMEASNTPRGFASGDKESYVVEFLFPPGPEFGVFSKLYSVSKHSKIREIKDLVFTKSKIAFPDKFELTTLALKPLEQDVEIKEYGLGSFFPSWQLKIVDKEYPYTTGTMEVDINLPNHPHFESLKANRIQFVVDVLQQNSETLEEIFSDLGLKKHHLFQLKYNGNILEDDDTLVRLGFGTIFSSAEIDIVPKVFPASSGDKAKDLVIVKSILDEVINDVIKIGQERSAAAKERMCRGIIFDLLRKAVFETEKAYAFCGRIASLSSNRFSDVVEYLLITEQEERARCKIAGYNKMVDSAHEDYMREADEQNMAAGLIPSAPVFDGRSLMPRKINIFAKKTATANNAVSAAGGFSLAEILSGKGALKKRTPPPPKEKKATSGVSDELFAKLQKRNQQVQSRQSVAPPKPQN